MTLPLEILYIRLRNELEVCSNYLPAEFDLGEEHLTSFPLKVDISLEHTPGPIMENDKVTYRYSHRLQLIIGREYPFEKPLVIWRTPIFHPNIMMPEDGGHVCIKLLSEWSFNSTLSTFIKGLESMLIAPNGGSPFGTDSCTSAAQYYNSGKKKPIPIITAPPPKVVRS
ncbi:MAG TPA: ubiquitin-conjugating enzyme E2 [Methanomassiliicoccales archaeon]|nr:ubiquitin-conjugating enzyme E2 [Methanomassiliicoccales archaeon]